MGSVVFQMTLCPFSKLAFVDEVEFYKGASLYSWRRDGKHSVLLDLFCSNFCCWIVLLEAYIFESPLKKCFALLI